MKKYQLSKTSILRWMFLRTLLFIALYIMFFDILNIHKTLFLKKITHIPNNVESPAKHVTKKL